MIHTIDSATASESLVAAFARLPLCAVAVADDLGGLLG